MAPTWTDEQTKKFDAACEQAKKSGTIIIGTDEFWEYVVNTVGVKDCQNMCEKITTKASSTDRLESTWTNEEIRKFKVAFETADTNLDITEFWDYISKEVGSGKSVINCKELFVKGAMQASKDNEPKNEK